MRLACVDKLVCLQSRPLTERLSTQFTHEVLYTCRQSVKEEETYMMYFLCLHMKLKKKEKKVCSCVYFVFLFPDSPVCLL